MREWMVGAVGSLAAAGMLWTGVSAQDVGGGEEAERAQRDGDRNVRVERLIRAIGPESRIGVTIADLEPADATQRGARVSEVRDESAAARAGVQAGDVITEFDGERVRSARQLSRLVSETPAGRTVDVTLLREGNAMTLKVTPERGDDRLGSRWPGREIERHLYGLQPPLYRGPEPRFRFRVPSHPEDRREWFERFHPEIWDQEMFGPAGRGRLGIVAQALSPQLAEFFGTKEGVLVSSVRDDSPAAAAGLRAGDVITAVDGEKVASPSDLVRAAARAERDVTIAYVREGKPAEAKVPLPPRERRERSHPI